MIFDRTENDIIGAKNVLEKLKSFEDLTEEETEILERGTVTINTLNRIEEKQKQLYSLFVSIGYYFPKFESKNWTYSDIFTEEDFYRIIENGELLRNAFFVYSETPSKANPIYYYSELNSIEKLLFDLQSMYEYAESEFRECDSFYCGEE